MSIGISAALQARVRELETRLAAVESLLREARPYVVAAAGPPPNWSEERALLARMDAAIAADSDQRLREGNHHPGYVIGQHWLSSAYARICAGEDEAEVMRDYGYVTQEAANANQA